MISKYKYVVDFYQPDLKLVIEVCGPQHFLKKYDGHKIETTLQLCGKTAVKVRRLEREGYKVVILNYQEFDLKDDNGMKQKISAKFKELHVME